MARRSDGSDEDRTLASAPCTVGLSPQAQRCKETFPRSLSVPPHFLVSMRAQWALFEGKTPKCSGDGSILRHLAHLLWTTAAEHSTESCVEQVPHWRMYGAANASHSPFRYSLMNCPIMKLVSLERSSPWTLLFLPTILSLLSLFWLSLFLGCPVPTRTI